MHFFPSTVNHPFPFFLFASCDMNTASTRNGFFVFYLVEFHSSHSLCIVLISWTIIEALARISLRFFLNLALLFIFRQKNVNEMSPSQLTQMFGSFWEFRAITEKKTFIKIVTWEAIFLLFVCDMPLAFYGTEEKSLVFFPEPHISQLPEKTISVVTRRMQCNLEVREHPHCVYKSQRLSRMASLWWLWLSPPRALASRAAYLSLYAVIIVVIVIKIIFVIDTGPPQLHIITASNDSGSPPSPYFHTLSPII